MKKLLLLVFMAFFLFGCGATVERSEFWKHSSHYRNCDHTLYSWFGYKTPTQQTLEQSQTQDWWGIPVQ
jgi:hypothetical protein